MDAIVLAQTLRVHSLGIEDALRRYEAQRVERVRDLVLKARKRCDVTHGRHPGVVPIALQGNGRTHSDRDAGHHRRRPFGMNIAQFNAAPPHEISAHLQKRVAISHWVDTLVAERPFTTRNAYCNAPPNSVNTGTLTTFSPLLRSTQKLESARQMRILYMNKRMWMAVIQRWPRHSKREINATKLPLDVFFSSVPLGAMDRPLTVLESTRHSACERGLITVTYEIMQLERDLLPFEGFCHRKQRRNADACADQHIACGRFERKRVTWH